MLKDALNRDPVRPMPDNDSFNDIMARCNAGDPDAARELFQRFGRRLIGLARTRLEGKMRAKVDPEDVMQSVFKSFFRRQAEEPFDLENWDSLWSLLTVLTLRKCGFRVRHFRTKARDVRREATPVADADESRASFEAIGRDPSASEAAMLNETVEGLLRDLDERDRRIVELSLQGYAPKEVGEQLDCAERTVQRLLARIKKRLERLGEEGD